MKLLEIIQAFESKVPLSLQEKWDHSGLNLGDINQQVESVLFSYDVCHEVVDKACELNCQLIVSHHPFRMHAGVDLHLDTYEGAIIAKCIKRNIALYSSHTNHDSSSLSLNHHYLKKFNLENIQDMILKGEGLTSIPAIYGVSPSGLKKTDLIETLKDTFHVTQIRFVSSSKEVYKRVGICTGSGSSFLDRAFALDLDLFITGDMKYHQAIQAKRHDLAVADVGHFHSEKDSVILLKGFFDDLFGTSLKLHVYDGLKDSFEFV